MSEEVTDEYLEKLRRTIMKRRTFSFVNDRDLAPLFTYLRQYKAILLSDEEYLQARDANELIEYTKKEIDKRTGKSSVQENRSVSEDSWAETELAEYVYFFLAGRVKFDWKDILGIF
jgi:hypothetical protein